MESKYVLTITASSSTDRVYIVAYKSGDNLLIKRTLYSSCGPIDSPETI